MAQNVESDDLFSAAAAEEDWLASDLNISVGLLSESLCCCVEAQALHGLALGLGPLD
ncbi:MAG TPA: hypothetical protein VIP57_08595 [Candidatus Dormibacteraeota bacterium]